MVMRIAVVALAIAIIPWPDSSGASHAAAQGARRQRAAKNPNSRPRRQRTGRQPRADRATQPPERRPQVPQNIVVQRNIEYRRVGQRSLALDLYRPRQAAEARLPAVVWIHGGGWRGGGKARKAWFLHPLVASGKYVGVSIDYRLSGEATWPAQIHDCKAAIRYLRAHADELGIDPQRIGVWGNSAGGHLASLLGTSGDVESLEGDLGPKVVSSRVACAVSTAGPSDFPSYTAGRPRQAQEGGAVFDLLGGSVEDKAEQALAASPVTYVTSNDPPFLIMHGTNDRVVPFQQGELLASRLEEAGVDTTFVRVVGARHEDYGPEAHRRIMAFFDKHLRRLPVEISSSPIRFALPSNASPPNASPPKSGVPAN